MVLAIVATVFILGFIIKFLFSFGFSSSPDILIVELTSNLLKINLHEFSSIMLKSLNVFILKGNCALVGPVRRNMPSRRVVLPQLFFPDK